MILNFLRELIEEKNKCSIKGLVISGLDKDNFEIVFNSEHLTKKISVQCKKNENGKYISEDVKDNLLKEINK